MLYKTSKLAREISQITEIPMMIAWDILNDLGYEPKELLMPDVNKWAFKVERKVNDAKASLHIN